MIGLLIVISQIVLVGFVGTWLTAQYAHEKAGLQKNLESIYVKTMDHVADSFIAQLITGPVLKDVRDGMPTHSFEFRKKKTSNFTTHIASVDIVNQTRQGEISDTMTSMLTRGIRTIVMNKSKDSPFAPLEFTDSMVFRKDFEQALKDEHANIKIQWISNDSNHRNLILNTTSTNNLDKVSVDGYQTLLLRKMAPQLGFSCLLLLLCGIAFTLSYTTARKQLLLSAQKDNFISNMSHELKTPVATARVAIEALRKFDGINDPVKTRDYLQMAAWEIDRLEALMANVLNNVQLEEGRIILQQQPLNIVALIQKMMDSMQPLFAEKEKDITYSHTIDQAIVTGDAMHLQGAIYNVLDNAIKYGGSSIEIALKQQAAQVIISISDNGPGIPQEYRKKIFEKFFRIPSGNVHDVKGYGLGLNYTHYVITAHNGSIREENNAHGGATFVITLPVAQA